MVDKQTVTTSRRRRWYSLAPYPLLREFLAEFIGTFVLVLFINGSQAQASLTDNKLAGFLANSFADGIGVMLGICLAGGVSGGHLNPAVTFAFACVGKAQWRKVPVYWFAQYLGAFTAASFVYGIYLEAIYVKTNGEFFITNDDPGYAIIFSTYPNPSVIPIPEVPIIDQLVGTTLLLICVSAIADMRNCKVPIFWTAFYTGMLIIGFNLSFSMICGAPLNPARDLSPRLLSYLVGWGINVFSFKDWLWFWVPIAIPHIGAALGALIYYLCLEATNTPNE